jgi:uncharacterized repeat protein (TIGR04076 family)
METPAYLDLGLDLKNMPQAELQKVWGQLGKIEIRMVEKIGECRHNLGEVYTYGTPYQKPDSVCPALLHVLDLFTWRVALGFPSWNAEDRSVYRIHCPDHTGTIWEMRRVAR